MRMPHFIIGGAPRSGTTFLCHFLDSHPDIFIAKPFIPEPKVFMTHSKEGATGYSKRYELLFSSAEEGKILGEKTSYYLENEQAFMRICQTFTEMKFIFLVREPVQRAYSNYLWSTKNNVEHLSFSEAIEREGQRENPFPQELAYAKPFDYLTRGCYDIFARRYINAFGQNNVKFFLFENLYVAPDRLLQDIQEFIGVSSLPLDPLKTKPINTRDKDVPLLDKRLSSELKERMRPSVERFSHYTGLDVEAWGY